MTEHRIIEGDVLASLRKLPDKSCQIVITSPPYLWLRNYGVKGQIGLEKTPAEYLRIIVEIFRELLRVLRPDGTVWLNMGDSYAGSGKGPSESLNEGNPSAHLAALEMGQNAIVPKGFKAGDLMGRGTVALVSRELGRSSISIDLSPEYVKIARKNLLKEQEALDTGVVNYRFEKVPV
ncbi:MAG: site-specific DNA-methyltransferase [Methanoregula sp.]|jgi:DNA modification methylase|nr:site-specific DNA-methyltransferase [Methanoregula sp.]